MKPRAITISREYGSGGRAVAMELSKVLGIPCYDNEIISKAAKESNVALWEFSMAEQRQYSNLIYTLSRISPGGEEIVPYREKIFQVQSEAMRQMVEKGPAIFLGRCGNYVLRRVPDCVHIFICGSVRKRMRRAVEEYGLEQKYAEREVQKVDKTRAAYYYENTGLHWGNCDNYDLVVNTDLLGVNGAVKLIRAYLDLRG